MYSIYSDGEILYAPTMADEGYSVLSPRLTMELNKAGSLEFKFLPSNPLYERVNKLKSVISVKDNNEEIWYGRVLYDKKDFLERKTVYCEGALSYFLDSVVSPYSVHEPIGDYMHRIVSQHNAQVDQNKQFTIGEITVTEDRSIVRAASTYPKTLNEINDKVINNLGGYITIHRENGTNVLDYTAVSGNVGSQIIRFGENLLDFEQYISAENIVTVLVPLGARGDNDQLLTIESVNEGKNYIESPTAIALFGRISGTARFDDVTIPSNLLSKGYDELANNIAESVTLIINAIDLNYINVDTEKLKLGWYYRVISPPHGINALFQLTAMTIDLVSPENSTYTFGFAKEGITYKQASVSEQINKAVADVPTIEKVREVSQASVTAAINSGFGGHTQVFQNEFLIMDTTDRNTAERLWRWNMGGLGYSSNGYDGPYETALTADGKINASMIRTGNMSANYIRTGILTDNVGHNYINLDTGEWSLHSEEVVISDDGGSSSLGDKFWEMTPIVLQIESSAGNIFKNRGISTILTARVFRGIEEITNDIPIFHWKKYNADGTLDESWYRDTGNVIQLSDADVQSKAVFRCEIEYSRTNETEEEEPEQEQEGNE